MASFGKCKLCDKEGKLISAHIIPRVYFEDTMGKSNQLTVLGMEHPRKSYTGVYDDTIVCQSCEDTFLSPLDGYGRTLVQSIHQTQSQVLTDGNRTFRFKVIEKPDYQKTKCFFTSILWRASVSTRPEYKNVSLGAVAETAAKEMLLKSIDVADRRFQLLVSYFTESKTVTKGEKMVLLPYTQRTEGRRDYRMQFGGIKILISADQRGFPPGVTNFSLRENAPWNILAEEFDDGNHHDIFRQVVKNYK